MEIGSNDGSKFLLKNGSETVFGRGLGFPSDDRTVSHRHVSFELHKDGSHGDPCSGTKVYFEVLGKNPIWVRDGRSGEIRVFRRFERGEMVSGDGFCVSAERPVWFTLKRKEDQSEDGGESGGKLFENRDGFAERLLKGGEDFGFDSLDVSEINPVKEFGFLVMGHEFDHYPKKMIRDIKNWNWFLEEPRKDSDDNEVRGHKRKRIAKRKSKIDEGSDDDEDWTGESEDDKELITKLKQFPRPQYSSTRSKDHNKSLKGTSRSSTRKKTIRAGEEDNDNEDDETLGGFIVDDDDVEQEEESYGNEEEKEEDFDEDDEDEE
ncbi:uncharacterized protein LOC131164938 [Malania oleifera]|uniref:uncharacterized protein LOC131164938 n=1 Tax=Malania oleifera TaxID=397392 RepID=UPI0025AE3B10|nr:uncharacterized protein LOC131164938 [Malania oleifera]